MFENRHDAGIRLGKKLAEDFGSDCLVLGIARGGIEVGYEVARQLGAAFSVIVVRKLPMPGNPETGFGAIAEDGSSFVYTEIAAEIPSAEVARIIEMQTAEIKRRREMFRDGKPLPDMHNRTVIVVDDGIAMGVTMHAALLCCRHQGAGKCIAAVPVAGTEVDRQLGNNADAIIVLEMPMDFHAVAQAYRHWHDVSDEEAGTILQSAGIVKKTT